MVDTTKRDIIFDPVPPWLCHWKCYWKCPWWDPLPPFLKLSEEKIKKYAALQEKMSAKMSEIVDEAADKLTAIEKMKNEEVMKIIESKQ